jgi:hypothetical protein
MRRASCGNDGAVESLENQKQVFHPSHSSLEISPKPRDSHISTAPTTGIYSGETEATARRIVGCGKVEIQNQDFHFPTAPDALRRKEDSIEEKSVNPNAVYTKLLTPPRLPVAAPGADHLATLASRIQATLPALRTQKFRLWSKRGALIRR